ncbi:endonuclease [Dongshaea marina]|uniref:endonuclease n=1 Tax=Dongshaea marina TaxID=2047966 RepID=UPI000D3EC30C|nr:endonuclease [Dongshaea marina]
MLPTQLCVTVAALFSLLLSLPGFAKTGPQQNFRSAKRELVRLYQQHPQIPTFYCRAPISWQGKKGIPELKEIGYKVRKQQKRANRIEWEHVMPAYWFGHQLKCWQQGGRKACEKHSARFRQMEGDMHNLVPSIGEVNGDRSNYRYSDWQGPSMYGRCEMAIDFKRKQARPPRYTHGFIGRDYLYMQQRYGIKLSKSQMKMMQAWAQQAPSSWECQQNKLITKLQGNDNPFVTRACHKIGLG